MDSITHNSNQLTAVYKNSPEQAKFIPVSKRNTCPLCGKAKWCMTNEEGTAAICGKTDVAPTGWKRIKDASDGRGIYVLETEDSSKKQVRNPRTLKSVSKQPKPAPIPAGLKLLRDPNEFNKCKTQPISDELWGIAKSSLPENRSDIKETRYDYGDGKAVYRLEWDDCDNPKGHSKTFRQSHVDTEGKTRWSKGDAVWSAYCIDEVITQLEGVPDGEPVAFLLVEGEENAKWTRVVFKIAAITFQGSSWGEADITYAIKALRATGKNVAIVKLHDNDDAGVKKAKAVKLACDRAQFPCIVVDPTTVYPDIPEKGDIIDIIKNSGMSTEEFIRRLEEQIHISAANSAQFEEWEETDTENQYDRAGKKKAKPTAREVAAEIAEQYGSTWKYDNEQQCWRIWDGKIWEKAESGNFGSLVKRTIDAREVEYSGSAFISDVLKLLEYDLRLAAWQNWDRARYINFKNCVLDGAENEALEHSPGMGFTSCLPYDHKPLEGDLSDPLEVLANNCPKVFSWMNSAMKGDSNKVLKLLAVINGLLKFRFFDLQMFVHLMGRPGTGKGTFIRLLEKVVGSENAHSLNELAQLKDGSTVAKAIGQQLLAVPDERSASSVGVILSWTGGDKVGYREIYKGAASAFFKGLLVIGSNDPIFVGNTTGLDRRLCLVHFDNPIPDQLRDSSIEAAMNAEIPQLIATALLLPNSTVTEALRGKGRGEIAEFKLKEWEVKTETNSVAAFFDECLVVAPGASLPAGEAFKAYQEYCADSGRKAVANNQFPKRLDALCCELGLDVKYDFDSETRKKFFTGLRLRAKWDNTPSHSENLTSACSGFTSGLTSAKPLPDSSYIGLQQVLPLKDFETEIPSTQVAEVVAEVSEKVETEKITPNPVQPMQSPVQQGIEPLQDPLQADVNPMLPDADPMLVPESVTEPLRQAEQLRGYLAIGSTTETRKLMNELKRSGKSKEVKALLTDEEALRLRELGNCGFMKGTRVRYVGDPEYAHHYDCELVVDEIKLQPRFVDGKPNGKFVGEVACQKPDGSFTTWLKPSDLEAV